MAEDLKPIRAALDAAQAALLAAEHAVEAVRGLLVREPEESPCRFCSSPNLKRVETMGDESQLICLKCGRIQDEG